MVQNSASTLIVFVCDRPNPRSSKLAFGLKSLGCQVVLLHRDALPSTNSGACYDACYRYRNPAEALQLAQQFKPLLFHLFSSWNFDTPAFFLKNKPGRIVFDDYDVIAGVARPDFIAAHYPSLLETERFCLEHADGITCRDLLLQVGKREMHYQLGGRLLYLPDCCWGDSDQERPGERGIDPDALHLAYAGNLAFEKLAASPHARDNFYFLDFAKDIAAAGIHFHVYPSPNFSDDFENLLSEHLELAASTPYYHVHRPLPSDLLVEELSRYDLGLLSMWKGARDSNKAYLPVIFSHSTSNKIFDYLDAGLGIVTCDALRFQRWFLSRQNICVSSYLEDVTATLLAQPLSFWRGLRKRVRLTRRSFSAQRHAGRLLAFYGVVSAQGKGPLPGTPSPPGEHLTLAEQAFRRGDIGESIREAKLELLHFPGEPGTQHFLSFLQTYSLKRERMSL
jgi:hypothetical protein